MAFLQGKPLQARKRIAVIATGCVAVILVGLMVYLYINPPKVSHDPEGTIMAAYTTILEKGQSLFHRK